MLLDTVRTVQETGIREAREQKELNLILLKRVNVLAEMVNSLQERVDALENPKPLSNEERIQLMKSKLDQFGINYAPNSGIKKLTELLNEIEEGI